ncbi:MAG TPA: DUF1203 domain-containing protein [Betaproteobacteria bacterium]|nr:DUF1203 domain-containing protein [Betaproteobacteria bacterium]
MKIAIRPMREDFLLKVREANLDDQNQKVVRLTADGGEPCRDVLRRARPGEELILASYCPFTIAGPYKEYGPVFVLTSPSTEVVDYQSFPLPKGSPTDYLREQPFVLRAYSKAENIVAAELLEPSSAQAVLNTLFEDSQVAFILARYAAYGCYSFRVERG